MPEIEVITLEEAIFQLVEILEHTPPEDRPEPWTVLLAVAEGYGEGVDLSFPVKWSAENGPDA